MFICECFSKRLAKSMQQGLAIIKYYLILGKKLSNDFKELNKQLLNYVNINVKLYLPKVIPTGDSVKEKKFIFNKI